MKDQYIKIRVTKQEKERLLKLAGKEKNTLSNYLLHKGLAETDGTGGIPLPEKIEILDFLNEVYHESQKCGDEKLGESIKLFYQKKFSGLQEDKK